MPERNVIVVGAGLGGLALTLALLRAGIPAVAYDQAPELAEVGAGLMLSPNASRALRAVGVYDAVAAKALRPGASRVRDWQTGEVRSDITYGPDFQARFGEPLLTIHRADIQRALIDGVEHHDPQAIQLDHRLTGIEQRAGEVQATFANGREVRGAVLIGSDGVRSLVRDLAFQTTPPRFTGYVAWRGLPPGDTLGPVHGTDTTTYIGPRRHFVCYPIKQGAFINCVGIAESSAWEEESWNVPATIAEVLDSFAGWHPNVRTLIDRTPPERLFKWGLFDHEPLPSWTSGRVALLGDAAHPILPLLAQGAALALEDAVVLARAFRECQSIETALAEYERARLGRTAWTQHRARVRAELFHSDASEAELRAERAEANEVIFTYDAAAVQFQTA